MSETGFVMWRAVAFGLALVTTIDFIKAVLGPENAHFVQMIVLVSMTGVVLWKTSDSDIWTKEEVRIGSFSVKDESGAATRRRDNPERQERHEKKRTTRIQARDSNTGKSSRWSDDGPRRGHTEAQWRSSSDAAVAAAAAVATVAVAANDKSLEDVRNGVAQLPSDSQSSTRCPSITSIPTTPRNPPATPDAQTGISAAESLAVLASVSDGGDALGVDKDGLDLKAVPNVAQSTMLAMSAAVSEALAEAGVEIDFGDFVFHLEPEDVPDALPVRSVDLSDDEVLRFIHGDEKAEQLAKAYADSEREAIVASEQITTPYMFPTNAHMMGSVGVDYGRSSNAQCKVNVNVGNHYVGSSDTPYPASGSAQYTSDSSAPLQYIPFGAGYLTLPTEDRLEEPSWHESESWRGSSWQNHSWREGSSGRRANDNFKRRGWPGSSNDSAPQKWVESKGESGGETDANTWETNSAKGGSNRERWSDKNFDDGSRRWHSKIKGWAESVRTQMWSPTETSRHDDKSTWTATKANFEESRGKKRRPEKRFDNGIGKHSK